MFSGTQFRWPVVHAKAVFSVLTTTKAFGPKAVF